MEDNQFISNNENNNNTDEGKLTYSQNLVLNLLKSYSYNDIMNYLFDQGNKISASDLRSKLKELVQKIDIDELAKLLTKEEINKLYSKNKKDENQYDINSNKNEEVYFEKKLKLENDCYDKNKIKRRKKRDTTNPIISKIIYKKEQNTDEICFYRYIGSKKENIYLLRCQDKECKSKAFYNFESKEICIYKEHSKDLQKHIYLSDKSQDYIKGLVSYMKNNKNISSVEIYSDNSKTIINNIKENHCLRNTNEIEKEKENNINNNSMLNKKRNNSPIKLISFLVTKDSNYTNFKFKIRKNFNNMKKENIFNIKKINKNHNNNKKQTINENNMPMESLNLNSNEQIILNEEEEKCNPNSILIDNGSDKEEFVNIKENYCEIKDKYLKHKQLLTKIEQLCFGENRRLGTHFHKEKDGKIYNYFGNNKEIKDFNMNYRCILKGCKSKAIYNLKSRTFTVIREHSKPYEEHNCSNPFNKRTKEWINYLKINDSLSDLQIILI